MKPTTLKAYRLTHLYTGVFFAPAILFFAITGSLQMFSLHEASHAPGYVPPPILVRLSRLHKTATLELPAPAAPKPAPKPAPKLNAPPAPKPAPFPTSPRWKEHLPEKIFFGLTALGLVVSTISGLVMAWKYSRRKLIPSAIFLTGIALPLFLLLF